jgi:signal transduction histidine kinase
MVKYRKMKAKNRVNHQKLLKPEQKAQPSEEIFINYQKEKEEFINIAAHELKAPLRKITTFSQRLAEKCDQLNEEALSYLKRIENNIEIMQSLIDDLSAFSQIPANADFAKCEVDTLINEVLTESAALVKKSNAAIHFTALPSLECNSESLKKVFKNLIDNSIKFQPKGQDAQIRIESQLLSEEEKIKLHLPVDLPYYKITFADNGIGFEQENANKVFKPFQRLNGKSEYAGNGLGLAICKKIIDMHKGLLYANGNLNTGCLFVLILPQTRN